MPNRASVSLFFLESLETWKRLVFFVDFEVRRLFLKQKSHQHRSRSVPEASWGVLDAFWGALAQFWSHLRASGPDFRLQTSWKPEKTKKNRGVRVRFVEHTSNQIYSKSPKITRLCPVQKFLRRENVIKSLRKSRWNFLQNSDIMKLFYLNRSEKVFLRPFVLLFGWPNRRQFTNLCDLNKYLKSLS